jgi:hypothetical protein
MSVTVTTTPITEGLEFILSQIESPIFSGDTKPSYFNLWPKTISTAKTEGAQIRVNFPNEAISEFYKAIFLDCKINVFLTTLTTLGRKYRIVQVMVGVELSQTSYS